MVRKRRGPSAVTGPRHAPLTGWPSWLPRGGESARGSTRAAVATGWWKVGCRTRADLRHRTGPVVAAAGTPLVGRADDPEPASRSSQPRRRARGRASPSRQERVGYADSSMSGAYGRHGIRMRGSSLERFWYPHEERVEEGASDRVPFAREERPARRGRPNARAMEPGGFEPPCQDVLDAASTRVVHPCSRPRPGGRTAQAGDKACEVLDPPRHASPLDPARWSVEPRLIGRRAGFHRGDQAARAYCVLAVESVHPFYVAWMLHDAPRRTVIVRSIPVGPD